MGVGVGVSHLPHSEDSEDNQNDPPIWVVREKDLLGMLVVVVVLVVVEEEQEGVGKVLPT